MGHGGAPYLPTMSINQLIAALLTVLALSWQGSAGSVSRTAAASPKGPEALRATFGLLRSPEETLPKPLQAHLSKILFRKGRLSPSLVQREAADGRDAWAFSTRGMVCLAQGGRGSAACTSPKDAIENGVTLGAFSPPSTTIPRLHDFLVIGLVPDSVALVHITIGRADHVVAVHNNMFSVASDTRPITVHRFVHRED